MNDAEIAELKLEKGDHLRMSTPTTIIEGHLEAVRDNALILKGSGGMAIVKFGQIQTIVKYDD